MSHSLPLTGERTLPGVRGEEYWFARHEAAYRWIGSAHAARLDGAVVVEAGSGEGYGAQILREAGARTVIALEYDELAVVHAGATYRDVRQVRCNLAGLPLSSACADAVVSLQVVEHLWDLRGFLRDCVRVLRPGGLLVVTTPNRPVFSPGLPRGAKPTNPFHVEELDAEQLAAMLVEAGLVDVDVTGLHHGPRILAWERDNGVGVVPAQVAAIGGAEDLPASLDAFVSTVRADDFRVGRAERCQDLVATGARP